MKIVFALVASLLITSNAALGQTALPIWDLGCWEIREGCLREADIDLELGIISREEHDAEVAKCESFWQLCRRLDLILEPFREWLRPEDVADFLAWEAGK